MNRRQFAVSLSAAGVLIGCNSDEKQSHATSLLDSSEVQYALKTLDSAIVSLEEEVSSLDEKNCRQVAPDVETATTDVRNAFDRLKAALGVRNS
jgi:hypothetical protein